MMHRKLRPERRDRMNRGKQIAVQGKTAEAWMQIFQKLSYEWEKVWKYGTADNMWPDGITLNHIRKEMIHAKELIEESCNNEGLVIPDEMPRCYMANADKIRTQAKRAQQGYLQDKEYQYLCQMERKLIEQQKERTQLVITLGKVRNLIRAIEQDDLVVMREYGNDGQFSKEIYETAENVRMLPMKQEINKVIKETLKMDKDDGDWQLEGQMTIYDFVS